ATTASGLGWPVTGASGAARADFASLPFGQAKLSARPGGAATVSPFATTLTAVAAPGMGLLPGPPRNSSGSFGVAPPVSGTTGPVNGLSAGFAPDGAGSTNPEGSATGTRLLIFRLNSCST